MHLQYAKAGGIYERLLVMTIAYEADLQVGECCASGFVVGLHQHGDDAVLCWDGILQAHASGNQSLQCDDPIQCSKCLKVPAQQNNEAATEAEHRRLHHYTTHYLSRHIPACCWIRRPIQNTIMLRLLHMCFTVCPRILTSLLQYGVDSILQSSRGDSNPLGGQHTRLGTL